MDLTRVSILALSRRREIVLSSVVFRPIYFDSYPTRQCLLVQSQSHSARKRGKILSGYLPAQASRAREHDRD